jgi:hypothetical protein
MEEKIISEKERLRRERLAERRKAGYRAYIERKHKEMEEREEKKRLEKEERKRKSVPKKRKVGRPKKRGPKKKRKYVSRKPKIDRRTLNVYDYKVVSCHNGKQDGYYGAFVKMEDAYETVEQLLEESKGVIFPARVQITDRIINSRDEYLILEKNRYGDKEAPLLRNEYGKLVRQETNSDTWIVLDKFPYEVEETFWVYGYDPVRGRKTFEWIYYNILLYGIETAYDIKRVMLYKNKVIIKDDAGNLDIVFCKTVSDGIRFYNMLSEWSAKRKLKQIMFLGNYSEIGDKRRKLEAELMEKTGWTIRKIQMSTSKKCRL